MKGICMEISHEMLVEKVTSIVTRVDQHCGLGNLVNFVSAGNKSVGEVTVAWGFGFEVITRLESALALDYDMDEENWKDYLEGEMNTLRRGFEHVFQFKNQNIELEGKPFQATRVLTKITTSEEIDKILTHKLCADQIVKFYEATASMDTGSISGLCKAAKLFIEIGRFFQELTIDSAKTADVVYIPYFEDMETIHLASRQLDEKTFNAQINWDGKQGMEKIKAEVDVRKEEAQELYENKKYFEAWKSHCINYKFKFKNCATVCYEGEDCEVYGKSKVAKYVIVDQNHQMRKESLYTAAQYASEVVEHKQVISDEFKNFVAEIAQPLMKKYSFAIKTELDKYRSITTAKQQELHKIREAFGGDKKELLESKLSYAKKGYDLFFDCIANNVRAVTSGLKAIQRAALAFHYIISTKTESVDGNPNKISAFAHDCLKEETLLLMLEARKRLYNKDISTVQAKLVCSDFAEGTTVTFKDGVYREGLYRAIASEKINGEFTIRKDENGYFYAEGNLVDFISSRIPKGKSDQVCFMTYATDECSAAVPMAMKKLAKGKEVILAGYHYSNGVKDLKDSVVVDGEEVIKYICGSSKDQVGTNEYGRGISFRVGKVAAAFRYVKHIPQGNGNVKSGDYDVIICVLEDVKDLVGKQNSERLNNIKPLKVDVSKANKKAEEKVSADKYKNFKPKFIVDDEPAAKEKTIDSIMKEFDVEMITVDSIMKEFGAELIA